MVAVFMRNLIRTDRSRLHVSCAKKAAVVDDNAIAVTFGDDAAAVYLLS